MAAGVVVLLARELLAPFGVGLVTFSGAGFSDELIVKPWHCTGTSSKAQASVAQIKQFVPRDGAAHSPWNSGNAPANSWHTPCKP